MTDPTSPEPDPDTGELLLDERSPSAALRREDALIARGCAVTEIASSKEALVSLASSMAPESPSLSLRARLAASLARKGRYGVFADRVARLFDVSPESAESYLSKLDDPSMWDPMVEGIELFSIRPGPRMLGAVAGFARLQPGARFPKHAHEGDELTLVLDGGFRDVTGDEIERGEELFKPKGSEHDFVVLEGAECIAAVLALNGIVFRG